MALHSGERQVAPVLDGIRRDHRARYEFAAAQLPFAARVIDVACGVGYGARILADAGHTVVAVDRDAEAIAYAREHYDSPEISYLQADLEALTVTLDYDAAVCFETIEHLADPLPLLRQLSRHAAILIASVPNEHGFPYRGQAFHHRHYTAGEFAALLRQGGWEVGSWWSQQGPESDVSPGQDVRPRTLVAVAHRSPVATSATPPRPASILPPAPESVAIVALGPTCERYVDFVKRMGGRHEVADQTWVINALGDVLANDLVFHMDDVRIQEVRAKAHPDGNIAAMLTWMRKHPGPIMTSRAHPDYPGLVEFPLQDVINTLECEPYFNGTAAYALAYALYRGAKRISLWGVDFTYPNAHHAEKGRACVEYLIGLGWARGVQFSFPKETPLLDSRERQQDRLYGYDTVDLTIEGDGEGRARVTMVPHDRLPTAEEIEARYDHSKHPNPLVTTSVKDGAQLGPK